MRAAAGVAMVLASLEEVRRRKVPPYEQRVFRVERARQRLQARNGDVDTGLAAGSRELGDADQPERPVDEH